MQNVDEAFIARFKNKHEESISYFKKAYALEQEAALKLKDSYSDEPTRSILFRSAASMALNGKLMDEAAKMIHYGLCGNPPDDIKKELNDLYEQVTFHRHLEFEGLAIQNNEMIISFYGPETGHGFIKSDAFIKRISAVEKMAYRTIERNLDLPFREKGQYNKDVTQNFQTFFSTPMAASYAVILKIASSNKQLVFPDQADIKTIPCASKIIDDILHGIDLINESKENDLESLIPDEAYYNNFISLARELAPDEKNISQVGLKTCLVDAEKEVFFKRKCREIPVLRTPKVGNKGEWIGRLFLADADQHKIRLIDETTNEKYDVKVPPGVLSDIVKPYWEETIKIIGQKSGKTIHLESFEKIE